MVFTAFFMQTKAGTFALGVVVGHRHRNDRRDPSKAVHHDADQRTITKPDQVIGINAIE